MDKVLVAIAIKVLTSQKVVLTCAEKHATQDIKEHVLKIRKQVDKLQSLYKMSDKDHDQKTVMRMNDELIKFIQLTFSKKYQMYIINKCSHELMLAQDNVIQQFKPVLTDMQRNMEKSLKAMNRDRRDASHTTESSNAAAMLATQLKNMNDTITSLVSCASKSAASTSDIGKHVKKIKALSGDTQEHMKRLVSTKTIGEMLDCLKQIVKLLMSLIVLTTNKKYLEHVYKNCQKEIYEINVATGERAIKTLSSIATMLKKSSS